ncbi:DUF2274 domain-containing protein [Sphingomonas sp. 28-63-12]|uniref:DUF2274 domain-containing protein n=1 Tax=Sphingomonas sp. 28-63-12 TaxID=1970434 RepID=UPI000BC4BDC0|nr:MAG: hypothetical protein B7Y47_00010 [Sphingomonas sp. 28-63-12]
MTLKLGPIADDKPVKVSISIPAAVYRDLTAYAEAHAAATGQASQEPTKLIVPIIAQFMATDPGFIKAKRTRPDEK